MKPLNSLRLSTLCLLFLVSTLGIVSCLNGTFNHGKLSTLTIKDAKSKWSNGISIQRAHAEVVITGNIAETTLELTIANSTNRTLEAALDLPLPEGASISRYALEVNGSMREGVVVDKEKGRVAFENTIRQNIDPGLLEKTKGNNFRTRIYPVPAKGTKRLLLSYTEPMRSLNANQYKYTLPLATKQRIGAFSLHIVSNHKDMRIGYISRKKVIINPTSPNEYSIERRNYRPANEQFLITHTGEAHPVIQRGNDGNHYFYLSQSIPRNQAYHRKQIKKLHLIWDSSHSSTLQNHKKNINLLERFFAFNPNVTVDLSFLTNTRSAKQRFVIQGGDFSALKKRLQQVFYDGATRLDQLDLRGSGYDAVFYIGDGIGTLGMRSNQSLKSNRTPVFVINSSPQANHNFLSQIAKQTNGAYINLHAIDLTEANELLTTQRYKLLKVSGNGISQVDFTTRSATASVVGRISKSSSTITLHYGIGDDFEQTETITISKPKHKRDGSMAAKLWAQSQVNQLSIDKKKNKARIIKLAKTHRLVTEFTSLIVLDRIADYVRYRIVPPTAKLRKEYYQQIKSVEKFSQGSKADLDEVYEDWKEMVKWHKTNYPVKWKKNDEPMESPPVAPMMRAGQDDSDFSGPAETPVIPAFTGGLRSGDFSVTRDSIDAFLNNPNGTKAPKNKISIKGWQPKTPYAKAMEDARIKRQPLLPVYLKWKKKYSSSTGFYLDAAEVFLKNGNRQGAIRVLSNLAEINPESAELLRVLAYRYSQMGEHVLAEMLLREFAEMRSEEPQSYRDLALTLAKRKRYSEASSLLWKVVDTEWDGRFYGIKMTVLNEWNQVMNRAGKKPTSKQRRFRYNIDADIRVVIVWDTDNTDMDLWVTGPDGEKCYYSNELTKRGGRISEDFLDGRGPEEFMIRRAQAGKYKIQANYYGTREQTLIGPTTLTAKVYTNWNRPNQKEKIITLRLGTAKQVIEIGDVER